MSSVSESGDMESETQHSVQKMGSNCVKLTASKKENHWVHRIKN